MPANIHIGCCGWSYLREADFPQLGGKKRTSKLQSYAELFPMVEINSSYYAIPKLPIAEKWRVESDAINPRFEFTIKMYKGITHTARFGGVAASYYDAIKPLIPALKTRVLLFQSASTFLPSEKNIRNMEEFFTVIERDGATCVWEPRGSWYDDPHLIEEVCATCNLVHCVDPFRNEPLVFGKEKMAYFRLHGFGKPSMYNYDFSGEELQRLSDLVRALSGRLNDIYILFNNFTCYKNGVQFRSLLAEESHRRTA